MDTLLILGILILFWLGFYSVLRKNNIRMIFFKINIAVLIIYSIYFCISYYHWDDKGFGASLFFTYTALAHTCVLLIIVLTMLFWDKVTQE